MPLGLGSLKIITEQPAHYKEVAALHDLAFGGRSESQLVEALRDAGDAVVSMVAEVDGHVAGHILLSRLKSPARSVALAPLAVAPQCQRRNVGSTLVRAALAAAREAGCRMVFVLGDPAYYQRFAFSRELAAQYRCRYAGEHFMAIALAEPVPEPQPVVYADAFENLV